MTPQQTPDQKLAAHIESMPKSPGSVGANHPAYKKFHAAFTEWVAQKERLECAARIDILVQAAQPQYGIFPACVPPSKPHVKPAWSGSSAEYNAEKKRQQRERDKKTPRPCMEPGCTEPRNGKQSRCIKHDLENTEKQRNAKNEARNTRRALIREGLNQRKMEAGIRSEMEAECLQSS